MKKLKCPVFEVLILETLKVKYEGKEIESKMSRRSVLVPRHLIARINV